MYDVIDEYDFNYMWSFICAMMELDLSDRHVYEISATNPFSGDSVFSIRLE